MKKSLLISVAGHLLLLLAMIIGDLLPSKPPMMMTAEIVFKPGKPRPKDFLPTKPIPKAHSQAKPVLEKPKVPEAEKKALAEPILDKKPVLDKNSEILKNLSDSFSEELLSEQKNAEEDEGGVESYLDLVYSLIKQSFIVPSHLEGPLGENLKAKIRLYITPMGEIRSVNIEKPSKDKTFDAAVMEGIKRVNNFGPPPDSLKGTLNKKGILIELCPVKCQNAE